MNFRCLLLVSCSLWLSLLSLAQPAPNARAAKELARGEAQFKKERYQEATASFMKAVQLDPNSIQARLHLARTLTQLYDPLVPEDSAYATRASEQFLELLRLNPRDAESLKGFASLMVRTQKPDEARHYYEQALTINPKDAEPYKGIGLIDWSAANNRLAEARRNIAFKYSESLITHASCPKARAAALPLFDAGIENLSKAFALADDDETVATYLSWAFNNKSELECNDPQARDNDIRQGQKWMQQATEAHKKNPNQPPPFTVVKL